MQEYNFYSGVGLGSFCCCSVAQSCPALCDPMDCSTPGFPVLHYFTLKFVSIESVMPSNYLSAAPFSCPQSFPASGSFPVSRLFAKWPKFWRFSFIISPSNEYSGLISFRIFWFDHLVIQGILKSLLQHHNSKV